MLQAITQQPGKHGLYLENALSRCLRILISGIEYVRERSHRQRTLRVCETLPLGDKRFIAIVQCHNRQLLIGATSHSITLLRELASPALQPEIITPVDHQHDPRIAAQVTTGQRQC